MKVVSMAFTERIRIKLLFLLLPHSTFLPIFLKNTNQFVFLRQEALKNDTERKETEKSVFRSYKRTVVTFSTPR